MARVIVHETFPYKLINGSVQVLSPGPDYQVVKREVADALVASGRGELFLLATPPSQKAELNSTEKTD